MTLTTTRPSTVGGLLFPGTDPAGESSTCSTIERCSGSPSPR